ncbi:MAG: hypothetical protein K0Q95_659 [Bacteroidota bacterium]|jgi:hypothetical protein|nr:hypothetical protein [Bacteroidota bacterium]
MIIRIENAVFKYQIKKRFTSLLLFISVVSYAQISDSGSYRHMHIELSVKVGGGITSGPFLRLGGILEDEQNDRNRIHFYDGSDYGFFETLGFQAALTGKSNIALVLEPGFTMSSQHLKYSLGTGSQAASYADRCDYSLHVQKLELAIIPKLFIDRKHSFYLNFGFYTAYETSKFISGTVEHDYVSNVSQSHPSNQSFTAMVEYDRHTLLNKGQNGALTGLGCNFFLKNNKVLFIDLRVTVHQLFGQNADPLRVRELGLSLVYTFIGN